MVVGAVAIGGVAVVTSFDDDAERTGRTDPAGESAADGEADPAQLYADGLVIRGLASSLNEAYARSPDEGLRALAEASYPVWAGSATVDDCVAAFRWRLNVLSRAQQVHTPRMQTLTLTPGRALSAIGGVPEGRLYRVEVEVSFRDPATDATTPTAIATMDVTVLPDGTAKWIPRAPCRAPVRGPGSAERVGLGVSHRHAVDELGPMVLARDGTGDERRPRRMAARGRQVPSTRLPS